MSEERRDNRWKSAFKEFAESYAKMRNPMYEALDREYRRTRQAMQSNMFDNNPVEIDRWADDGGKVRDR